MIERFNRRRFAAIASAVVAFPATCFGSRKPDPAPTPMQSQGMIEAYMHKGFTSYIDPSYGRWTAESQERYPSGLRPIRLAIPIIEFKFEYPRISTDDHYFFDVAGTVNDETYLAFGPESILVYSREIREKSVVFTLHSRSGSWNRIVSADGTFAPYPMFRKRSFASLGMHQWEISSNLGPARQLYQIIHVPSGEWMTTSGDYQKIMIKPEELW